VALARPAAVSKTTEWQLGFFFMLKCSFVISFHYSSGQRSYFISSLFNLIALRNVSSQDLSHTMPRKILISFSIDILNSYTFYYGPSVTSYFASSSFCGFSRATQRIRKKLWNPKKLFVTHLVCMIVPQQLAPFILCTTFPFVTTT
jgi:hypothetical protein